MHDPDEQQSTPSTNTNNLPPPPSPLCELRVADSLFLGYVISHPTLDAIQNFRRDLIDRHHPTAAHVPYAASTTLGNQRRTSSTVGGPTSSSSSPKHSSWKGEETYEDDGEPDAAKVGFVLLAELGRYKKQLRRQSTIRIRGGSGSRNHSKSHNVDDDDDEEDDCNDNDDCDFDESNNGPKVATAIIVVRYFNERLLGVTCGRLTAIYARAARLALHRHLNGRDVPFLERCSFGRGEDKNLYGLGAGDTELILNVVPSVNNGGEMEESSSCNKDIVERLLDELQFEGMVGSQNEPLPRLQNLQADLPIIKGASSHGSQSTNNTILPVYRYPGNYSGIEWPTHPYSPTSLLVKHAVEQSLRPLYIQHMNHCVTNLYRTGSDNIQHHSDKDLDLNREGVIVSVSLGSKRIMEVRDRVWPHDAVRVELPSGSMFVLGPYTNARFTHSILPMPKEEGEGRSGIMVGKEKQRRGGGAKRISFSQQTQDEGDDDIDDSCNNIAKCSIEKGGRISLTFRDVRTFLDGRTQRLFGQGIATSSTSNDGEATSFHLNEDGVIMQESLAAAVRFTRGQDRVERRSAAVLSLGMGSIVGYVTFATTNNTASKLLSSNNNEGHATQKTDSTTMAMLWGLSTTMLSTAASYWYLQHARRKLRQSREEKEARIFFSKKSASGNKY